MKRIIFVIVLLISVAVITKAQTTGYIGKRVLLKTDVINGLRLGFMNLDIEIPLARQFSLNLFGRLYISNLSLKSEDIDVPTKEVGFYYDDSYYEYVYDPYNDEYYYEYFYESGYASFNKLTTLSDIRTSGWQGGIGAKYYFNKIIPSPLGWYTSANIGFGMLTFSNFTASYKFIDKDWSGHDYSEPDKQISKSKGNLLFFEIPAIGYQTVIAKFLVIDAKISLEGYYLSLPANITEFVQENVFIGPNLKGVAAGKLSFGPSIYAKIGFIF